MSDIKYKVIVGLEIHVQLNTKTKMFCSCELGFAQQPNSRVCPTCCGMPGSLPVMNKQAVEFSVLAAMALNLEIPAFTKWDRKNYYYPDLPKNYQISQYDLPISQNGFIEIPLENGETKKVRLIRAHLEEDAGKNSHTSGNYSQVDLNRAGTPLLEIVTEPDLENAAQVKALAVELQKIVRYLGVSQADMQKGQMRFEPNINLAITKDGKEYRTPIAEIKNLNSFRAVERSVIYETQRQLEEFMETGVTIAMGNKSTRGWDDENNVTVLQREKEEAHDYRYLPDPDLVPIEWTDEMLDDIRAKLVELPIQKRLRFVNDYKLSDYDAGVLTDEKSLSDFFDETVKAGAQPKRACNLITQVGLKLANEKGCQINELNFDSRQLADLCKMAQEGTINSNATNTIFEEMASTGKDPQQIAEKKNLLQKNDAGEIEALVDQVIAENAQAVEDVKADGKKTKKARGFLMGQVIKKSKGQANPQIVSKLLNQKLS